MNVRPARFMPGMPSPLKDPAGFDVIVARENTEGEYSDGGRRIHEGDREIAIQVNVFSGLARLSWCATRWSLLARGVAA